MWQAGNGGSEFGSAADAFGDDLTTAVEALVAVQRQLAEVVATVTDAQYRTNPVDVVAGSIGGHVRHCLDHVEAILTAARCRALNYDDRRRDVRIEQDRDAALVVVARQEADLYGLCARSPRESLRMQTLVAVDRPPLEVTTTLGRELSFVISHTIHHSSLVAAMVRLLGGSVPERFGYAPSTLAHRERQACVRSA